MVRHLTYLLCDRGAAEDIAQEAFLRYLRRPPPDPGHAGAWLRLVATRLAYNHLRSERRRRAREEGLFRDRALGSADSAAGPGEEVADGGLLRAALDRLAPRDRLALLLRATGQDYRQIAQAIAVRPSSVGTILARATRRLKAEYLAASGGERPPDGLDLPSALTGGRMPSHDALR